MSVLEALKGNYNYNLARYYNGISYLEKHPSQIDKWIKELLEIRENIEILLEEIMKQQNVSKEEILTGFKEDNK